ncbi:Serine protease inhibitor dipetalogastin [Folsomia candida]|uniref:Serine protease inhibitor dipetalogastin n=1 Tax=Folsomia candida TaxID=158441 RepID=A0A226F5W2_FOLCA|nr:Serine protease inhibitor dipetalogastin [Folsomia candida]
MNYGSHHVILLALVVVLAYTVAPTEGGCGCLDSYTWVCGSDGKSYQNMCFMHCLSEPGVKVVFDGSCERMQAEQNGALELQPGHAIVFITGIILPLIFQRLTN